MRNICFICETIIDNQHKLEMKVFFYLILVLTLMSCIQLTSISLVNTTNEPIKLCCYYNANNYADSVYIDKRDTSLLIFRSAWFHSSKKVRRAYINHMDSLIIQSLSKRIVYRDNKSIYEFLINNNDTDDMVETRVN